MFGLWKQQMIRLSGYIPDCNCYLSLHPCAKWGCPQVLCICTPKTRALPPPPPTHTYTHTRTHIHAHTHTHTHTRHRCPQRLQQWHRSQLLIWCSQWLGVCFRNGFPQSHTKLHTQGGSGRGRGGGSDGGTPLGTPRQRAMAVSNEAWRRRW